MTRNLKMLGLALVAACALSAITASVASAVPALFTANVASHAEKAKIHGEQVGTDTFTIGVLPALTCTTVTLEGEAETAGTSSTNVELTPTYNTCHVQAPLIGTRTVTVTTNGCKYTFNATKNTNSAATGPTPNILTAFSADLHIKCPDPNKGIEIHIYNTPNHTDTGAATLCTYDILPQTILNQIQLTNEPAPAHDVLAHVHAHVTVTNTITGGICGNTEHVNNAIYKGTTTLRAKTAAGVVVGSTVS